MNEASGHSPHATGDAKPSSNTELIQDTELIRDTGPTQDTELIQDTGPIRIVLAKLGLDGHDRGLKVVARTLRDAGMEVIYLGLRQTADSIVAACEQEDADVIGLSMHNAGHLTLAPRMVKAVGEAGLDVPVVIGGIVPAGDVPVLMDAGVAAVLGPGASSAEVVSTVRAAAAGQSDPQ